jgi:galactokinase
MTWGVASAHTAAETLEAYAARSLDEHFGAGSRAATAAAPGRVTLVGEHVDYVGGLVACMAIDLRVAVALRPARDGRWRVASAGRRVERSHPVMAGDIGDRLFAAALALRRRGLRVPPLEMAVAATLPESVGLSSSAALMLAALVATLRLTGVRLASEELVAAALVGEREIVGVPCGQLDQRAIVQSRAGSALVIDCATGETRNAPWPRKDVTLVAASSAEHHDVGGAEYRARREAAEQACTILEVSSCQEIGGRWRELPLALQGRGRHIATETQRTAAAVSALEGGDIRSLGALLNASHESLRTDYEVSTARLDAMCAAARAVPGCYGARLVGAGFGGSVIALVDSPVAERCVGAMSAVSGVRGGWSVHPAAGLEVTAVDAVG